MYQNKSPVLISCRGTNVYWTAVWTSVTQISNGTNIYGPANVGSSNALAQRWITAEGDTYNSDCTPCYSM